MDQRERSADPIGAMTAALAGWQRGIWTALPGIVKQVNSDGSLQVQPSVKAVIVQQDRVTGSQSQADTALPLLPSVPVVWPGGGGFVLTFPISAGDEVLIVFASRCIDAWWQSGGVQKQIERRAHDLSDGIAIPRLFSLPNAPGSISTSSAQLRSQDGSTYLEIAGGQVINIVAPGGLTVTGNLHVSGAVVSGFGGSDQVSLQTHKHGGGPAPNPGT